MPSFETLKSPDVALSLYHARAASDAASSPPEPRRKAAHAREVIDVFIDGAHASARASHASCVLRDLATALAELAGKARGKAIVRLYDDAWELCIERLGAKASLSVYRAGSDPTVTVLDRWAPWSDVVESARDAIHAALGSQPRELAELEATLATACESHEANAAAAPMPEAMPVSIELDRDAPIAIGADFAIRPGSEDASEPRVERADLHALLFRGRLRADVRGRGVELGEAHPFLFAERLLEIARRALDAWERGQPLNERNDASGIMVGVRLAPDAQLALTLGAAATGTQPRALHTFPALGVADVIEAALAFGRALVRAILRRDRSQCHNLRLSGFRRTLRETSDALREAFRADTKVNPTPEPYRAFANVARGPRDKAIEPDAPLAAARLRYAPRWRALIPGIDLRATFLCGERLIVGAAAEMFCLDRATGQVNWRVETERATCVLTPGGIARIHADGALAVHDFGTGEVTLRTWLAPRLGGPVAGAVVHVPSLPRLLVVTEGERHLVAVDLTSGEPRWRFAWSASSGAKAGRAAARGTLKMKRAGKLLYFTSGDSALTALDVLTGAVVWRVRDRLRFRAAPTLDGDTLFGLAGGMNCATQLHAIDPYSGHARWTRGLASSTGTISTPITIEGAPLAAGGVVALAVRDRHGLTMHAFDRETGAPRWTSTPRVAPIGSAWIALDDLLIANTPTGEIVAIEASTGALRYRHVLGRVLESDVPRRLEPVLRSGALFVPHVDVQVLRPRDGALLGTISPCEAIPDLLRVDERCDAYIAEESGHLISFGAGPRLSLVRSI